MTALLTRGGGGRRTLSQWQSSFALCTRRGLTRQWGPDLYVLTREGGGLRVAFARYSFGERLACRRARRSGRVTDLVVSRSRLSEASASFSERSGIASRVSNQDSFAHSRES